MVIFGGSSHIHLAKKVAEVLGARVGRADLSRFVNDEARVLIQEEKVGREAVVIQSLSMPTDHHLVEFCLMCDALKRMGVKEITAVIPWLGYSKQDKVFRKGEPLSVKVIAKILQTVTLEKIITFDLHNASILGFFEVPIVHLSARQLFMDYYAPQVTGKSMVVSPDAGAVKSSTLLAQELGVEVAYIDKKRDLQTGEVKIMGISREVGGKDVFIFDDMMVTGSTLLEVAEFLKAQGAGTIQVAATHHTYVPGAQAKIDESPIDVLAVTDTIEPQVESPKLRVLSVAHLIADAILG